MTCQNDDTYIVPPDFTTTEDLTCIKLRHRESRRTNKCKLPEVNRHCPQTCGVCCEDDPDFTFPAAQGRVQNCAWIAENQDRANMWCNKHPGNGGVIRNACPVTCNFCFDHVKVPTSSPSLNPTIFPTISSRPSSSPSKSNSPSLSSPPSGLVLGGAATNEARAASSSTTGTVVLVSVISVLVVGALGLFMFFTHRKKDLRTYFQRNRNREEVVETSNERLEGPHLDVESQKIEWTEMQTIDLDNKDELGTQAIGSHSIGSRSSLLFSSDGENSMQEAFDKNNRKRDIDLDVPDLALSALNTFDESGSLHSDGTDKYSVHEDIDDGSLKDDEENALEAKMDSIDLDEESMGRTNVCMTKEIFMECAKSLPQPDEEETTATTTPVRYDLPNHGTDDSTEVFNFTTDEETTFQSEFKTDDDTTLQSQSQKPYDCDNTEQSGFKADDDMTLISEFRDENTLQSGARADDEETLDTVRQQRVEKCPTDEETVQYEINTDDEGDEGDEGEESSCLDSILLLKENSVHTDLLEDNTIRSERMTQDTGGTTVQSDDHSETFTEQQSEAGTDCTDEESGNGKSFGERSGGEKSMVTHSTGTNSTAPVDNKSVTTEQQTLEAKFPYQSGDSADGGPIQYCLPCCGDGEKEKASDEKINEQHIQ